MNTHERLIHVVTIFGKINFEAYLALDDIIMGLQPKFFEKAVSYTRLVIVFLSVGGSWDIKWRTIYLVEWIK